jgi:hypothetical protein
VIVCPFSTFLSGLECPLFWILRFAAEAGMMVLMAWLIAKPRFYPYSICRKQMTFYLKEKKETPEKAQLLLQSGDLSMHARQILQENLCKEVPA